MEAAPAFLPLESWGSLFHSCATQQSKPGPAHYSFRFFMFIGRLDSWQSPECNRDLRFE